LKALLSKAFKITFQVVPGTGNLTIKMWQFTPVGVETKTRAIVAAFNLTTRGVFSMSKDF